MTDDLLAFAGALDRCWIERRHDDLADFIAVDIVMVAPVGQGRIEGLAAAIESYREFMSRAEVRRYERSGQIVTERGDTAVIEYDWAMSWEDGGSSYDATGRELLVLARHDRNWRVVWRTQLPS